MFPYRRNPGKNAGLVELSPCPLAPGNPRRAAARVPEQNSLVNLIFQSRHLILERMPAMSNLPFRQIRLLTPGSRYAIAIISTLITIWIRLMLDPWLREECPFSLFYLSVLLTAWLAGAGPAALAIVLGTFSAAYFFIVPQSSFAIDSLSELIQVAIFVIVNCVATILFVRLNRQRSSGRTAIRRQRETKSFAPAG